MRRLLLSALAVALTAATCAHAFTYNASAAADLVTSLPDFNGPFPSKHYSGYLKAANESYLHYYFVEASEVDPATAPVVFWTNGGPGCSSMDGWGYELGPFHFKNYGAKGPTFELNNYTWSKTANILFVENPPGVGFSFQSNVGPWGYSSSDSQNAANNYAAVQTFFTKFPQLKTNKFYIAGESYGGIYVPTLADQILTNGGVPGFQGILVGNGVTSSKYDDNFYWSDGLFAFGHGFLSEQDLSAAKAACVPPAGSGNSIACDFVSNAFTSTVDINLNWYDYTANCFMPPAGTWDLHIPALRRRIEARAKAAGVDVLTYIEQDQERFAAKKAAGASSSVSVPSSPQGGNVPCIDSSTMETYLNRADVKKALHVPETIEWNICSDINYSSDIPDVVFVYKKLLAAGKRVLIYNGNTDMAVPYTGTKAWIEHETNWTVSTPLQGWMYNDAAFPYGSQQGGFATGYEGNQVWFAMVNGAGHMVPQFRPAAAESMFKRFMSGEGFTQQGPTTAL